MRQLRTVIGVGILMIFLMIAMAVAVNQRKEKKQEAKSGDFASARYPYKQLDERGKKLYTALYEGIADFRTRISLPDTYTADEYKKVYLLLTTQEPEFFYLDTTYETAAEMSSVGMHYTTDRSGAEKMTKDMESAADRILRGISPVLSEQQKMLMIHDGIAENCIYEKTAHSSDAYGCLVEGAAQCEGYAKAFLYVARRAGLEAMCVPGVTIAGEAHIWNKAKIDGKYYNIDVTWDDDDTYEGEVVHSCFAASDRAFLDHEPDESIFSPPSGTDATKTYYQLYGLVLNEASRLPEMVRSWYGQRPGNVIEFRCTSDETLAEAKMALKTDPEVRRAIEETTGSTYPRMYADEERDTIVILP